MKQFLILFTVFWAGVLFSESRITDSAVSKFLKESTQTSNEYATGKKVEEFFKEGKILSDKAIVVLKPHLTKETADAWQYHIVLIKNPGFTMFGDLTVDKKTKEITRSDFMWKKFAPPAASESGEMNVDKAYQILLETKLFGFGNKKGVKKPRDTDEAYKTILKDPNDTGLFIDLFDEGNIYAKMFALCALFHLDHKAYLERIARLDKKEKIETRNGCVYDELTVGKILDNIENSKYEYMYQRPNKLPRIDKEKAKNLFNEYFKKKGEDPEGYDIKLKPYRQATWLVTAYTKRLHPAIGWRHIITHDGTVKEISDDSLNVLFMNEYPLSADTGEEKNKVIKAYLDIYSGETIDIINKATDIPGHDKRPLDEDLAPAIRAPYVNKDGVIIVYTYQKIGGIVRRFRFHWTKDQRFRKAEVADLAKDIGSADYYE